MKDEGKKMKEDKLSELLHQIDHVIPLLERACQNQPSSMMELISNRYKNAQKLLQTSPPHQITKDQFHIRGGVRAYLEVASDYMNPILGEMDKAEKLLEQAFQS